MPRITPLRIAVAICLLAVCMMALMEGAFAISRSFCSGAIRDYAEYWAAGQLFVHGENPYAVAPTLRLELSAGFSAGYPLITPSPPIILFLVAPLGFVSAQTGAVLWMALSVACLVTSIQMLWILLGRPAGQYHLLCYCFAPVLTCLVSGQIGIILLFGVVLFLYFHNSRPFLAGAALLPCALKPHLFLPIAIVLLLWAVSQKAHRILAGIGAALLAACTFAFCFDPHAWSQYAQMISMGKPVEWFVPTLSKIFRLLVYRNAAWLQFLPEAAACCWAPWYFWTRRSRWNWMEQGMLLLFVSVACAPYAWNTDEAVLLPAILAGLYRIKDSGLSLLIFALIAGTALAELLSGIWITTPYHVWSVPAWFLWYLYVTKSRNKRAAAFQMRSFGM